MPSDPHKVSDTGQRYLRRRRFLTTSGLAFSAAIAGCGETEGNGSDDSPTDTPGEDPEPDESPTETEASDDSETGTESEPDTTVQIVAIDVPTTVEQGEIFDVEVTIDADVASTIRVALIDPEGDTADEAEADVPEAGEHTEPLSLTVSRQEVVGEGVVAVDLTAEDRSDETTVDVEIADVLEQWERRVRDARNIVEEYLDDFAAVGADEDGTILDTTVTDDYGSASDISPLFEADNLLGDARLETDPGTENRELVVRLRTEVDVLLSISRCQRQTQAVYEALLDSLDDFQSESRLRQNPDDDYTDAREQHDVLRESSEELDPVVGSNYEAKIEQLSGELDALDRLIGGIAPLFSARDAFEDEFYGLAFDRAQSARRDFELVVRDVGDERTYPPEGQIDDEFLEHAEEWESEADEIERQASNRQTEDEE